MRAYLAAVWRYRYFWLALVRMDLRARYRGSVLGLGWSLLQPVAMTVILCTVFGTLFHQPLRFYAPFVMAGLTLWNYVLQVSLQGCQCFFQGELYIRQYAVPLAIYPLRTMLSNSFHFGVALGVVLLLATGLRGCPGIPALLSLVPTVALLLLLGWALAVLFGLANVHFRDVQHLSEIGFQILFYLTPVMYPPELFQDRRLCTLLHFNPLLPFLNLLRRPLLDGVTPTAGEYGVAALIVVLTAGLAVLALRQVERRVIFHL